MVKGKFDSKSLQTWFSLFMLLALAALVVFWFLRRERLPGEIRIVAGPPGSLYHTFASAFGVKLEKKNEKKTVVMETAGAGENRSLLAAIRPCPRTTRCRSTAVCGAGSWG